RLAMDFYQYGIVNLVEQHLAAWGFPASHILFAIALLGVTILISRRKNIDWFAMADNRDDLMELVTGDMMDWREEADEKNQSLIDNYDVDDDFDAYDRRYPYDPDHPFLQEQSASLNTSLNQSNVSEDSLRSLTNHFEQLTIVPESEESASTSRTDLQNRLDSGVGGSEQEDEVVEEDEDDHDVTFSEEPEVEPEVAHVPEETPVLGYGSDVDLPYSDDDEGEANTVLQAVHTRATMLPPPDLDLPVPNLAPPGFERALDTVPVATARDISLPSFDPLPYLSLLYWIRHHPASKMLPQLYSIHRLPDSSICQLP
ncbi:hypothetical protein PFISCL1PPCAC_7464, partial [Pristionchus fissidentatus]